MTHPIFDAVKFPIHREDAQELHCVLSRIVDGRASIVLLYDSVAFKVVQRQRVDVHLPSLPAEGNSETLWREALDNLVIGGCLKNLCELLLSGERYSNIHDCVRRVMNAQHEIFQVAADADASDLAILISTEEKADRGIAPPEERLRRIAAQLLESDETRTFVRKCNGLRRPMGPRDMADFIFDAARPMDVLFNCYTPETPPSDVQLNMYRLLETVAPKCLTPASIQQIHRYFDSTVSEPIEVDTDHILVASSFVGAGKGLPVDISVDGNLRDRRFISELITSVPTPPRNADLINVVYESLRDNPYLDPDKPSVALTAAALENLASLEVFVCILLDQSPDARTVQEINEMFPDLILMVSKGATGANDARVIDQIKRLRKRFG